MLKNTILKCTLFLVLSVTWSCTKGPFGELSELNFAPAKLTFDKQTYSFGEVGVGSAALTKFTLYNTSQIEAVGCETLELSDNTNFAVYSSTCDKENMRPNETCEVEVLSQPQSVGTKTLTLSRKCKNTEVTTTENEITAIAFVPDLSWSPLTKNFGSIYVGANSSNEVFTLTNNGLAAATGCSAPVLADAVNFQIVSDTCASNNLAAAATCQVQVRARPQSTGNKKAHLYRTCAVGGTVSTTPNQIRVDGVLTNLAWSPLTYDFGTVNIGDTTIDQQFNLSNTGTAAATFCGLPSLSDTTNFSITADTCALNNLTHGSSCFVRVAASPQSAGLKQATLSRTCTVGGTVTTQVDQITVTGNSPTIAWSPQSHDFGTFNISQSSSAHTFTLTNNTALDAALCNPPYVNDWTGTFSLSNDTCQNNDLLAGQSCSVDITATPQQAGYTRATLYRDCWSSGSYYTQSQQIVVRGNGPYLEASPTYLSLGHVDPGQNTSDQTITFTNTGTQGDTNCAVGSLWNTTAFSIVSTTCGSSIASGASCDVIVKGHPQSTGLFTDTVAYYCDNTSAYSNIEVWGNGPSLSWNPNYHDFGGIDVGLQSSDLVLTLTNSSSITATGCVSPYLGNGTHFTLVSTTCGATLAGSGGSCTATVRGSPQSGGSHNDYISYDCTNGNAYASFDEIGNGPLLTVSPNGAYYGTVNVGDTSSAQTFTFQNNGNQNATGCGAPVLSNSTDFSISSNLCGTASIGSGGGYCTVDVVANPASSGTKQTTLSRTCTVGGVVATTTNNIQVQAVVNAPDLSWSIMSHNFGNIVVGLNSGDLTFVLVNNGLQPATSCSAPILSDATNFMITSDNCGSNDVAAVGSCDVQVRAIPQSSGVKQATLSRTCTVGGVASTTTNGIQVTGILEASWQQQFNLTDLGEYSLGVNGESDLFRYYFVNSNNENFTNCSAVNLTNSNDFSIVSTNCPVGTQNKKVICYADIKVNPLVTGSLSTIIQRSCDETGLITKSITASGNGVSGSVTNIASDQHKSCVVINGKVKCWGYYDSGYVILPKLIQGLTNVVKVATTDDYTCAVIADGKVKCWGSNSFGQLGDGTTTDRSSPVDVTGINNAVSISIGRYRSCAILADSTIKCWGKNSEGQLGNGTTVDSSVPVIVSGISNATHITVQDHVCARLSDSTVKCWGYGLAGRLGNGSTVDSSVPVVVSGISNAVEISSSGQTECALLADNTVKCWGYGERGELGNGLAWMSTSTPVSVVGVLNAVAIRSGWGMTCAILNDATMKCWGSDGVTGRIGAGAQDNWYSIYPTPVLFTDYGDIADVSIGGNKICAINTNAGFNLKCHGNGIWYGHGVYDAFYNWINTPTMKVPIVVTDISSAVSITSSAAGSCVTLSTGQVKCWGSDYGMATGSMRYAGIQPVVGVSGAIKTSVSQFYSCALINDGSIKCWGDGNGAGMGQYTNMQAQSVSGISNAIDIDGQLETCAVLSDGTVKCWNGSNNSVVTPYSVVGISNAVKITSGYYFNCALINDGTVKCWGNNSFGQLGDGTTTNSSSPVTVSSLNNVVSLSAGTYHACALINDGTVKCWGYNGSYQLGDGTSTSSSVPVTVAALSGVQSISLGSSSSCAVLTDHTVKCWGENTLGQLTTDQPNSSFNSPTLTTSLGLVDRVGDHFGNGTRCSILLSGDVQCHGSDTNWKRGYMRSHVYELKGMLSP